MKIYGRKYSYPRIINNHVIWEPYANISDIQKVFPNAIINKVSDWGDPMYPKEISFNMNKDIFIGEKKIITYIGQNYCMLMQTKLK